MMKRIVSFLSLFVFSTAILCAGQYRTPVKPTRNLIVMIPDGTAMSVLSAARWYQIYNKSGKDHLAVDPYLCGTVKSFSSNAPIADSAPSTSAYMTGMYMQAGNVSIYPVADPGKDLVPVDPGKAYQPLATILEAVKYKQNKAVGLVVTCEFPHATPADCSAHYYNRSDYKSIAPQIAYNNLDVMFGGGVSILTDDIKNYFKSNGTTLLRDDINGFKEYKGAGKVWALFCNKTLPYDLDRDEKKVPSLSEMTEKALEILPRNGNGFFLMVEGSKIDMAAHDNDAAACIHDYLAFDKAVQVAIDFARRDGNTTVVVMPDHSTGGFTFGNSRSSSGYNRKTLDELFKTFSKYKKTGRELSDLLLKTESGKIASVVKEHMSLDLKDDELNALWQSSDYKALGGSKGNNGKTMHVNLMDVLNNRTYFAFTTGGHTGEDVFLAVYHPHGTLPIGMNTNAEMNKYLFDVTGLQTPLDKITEEIFAKHTDVFKGMDCTTEEEGGFPVLVVKKGNNTLKVPAFKSIVYVNGKPVNLKSVVVYIDKNKTFYLPANLKGLLK